MSNVNILFLIIITFNLITYKTLIIPSLVFTICSEVVVASMMNILSTLVKKEYSLELEQIKEKIEKNSELVSDYEQQLSDIKNSVNEYDLECKKVDSIARLKELRNTYVSTYGLVNNDKTKKLK